MADITNKTVFIALHFRCLGVSRKVSKSLVTTEANKNMVTLSKRLFRSDAYQQIVNIQQRSKDYLLSRAVPTGLRGAVYALPVAFVSEVEDHLRAYRERMDEVVEQLVGEWDELTSTTAKDQLKDLYNAHDYPSKAAVAAGFGIEWSYISHGVPGALEDISSEVFKREQNRIRREVDEAAAYAKSVMRRTCLEFVKTFHNQLMPPADGSSRRRPIHESTLNRLLDFVENFKLRNLGGDDEMEAAIETMRALLNGVDAGLLRQDEEFKTSVETEMKQILLSVEQMVEDCPVRDILLD